MTRMILARTVGGRIARFVGAWAGLLAGCITDAIGSGLLVRKDRPPARNYIERQVNTSRYSLEREIGRGEMGIVYLARDSRLDRQLAVKVYTVPPGLSQEQIDEFRQRFLREAKAAAALSHPGIVTVHDAGEDPESGVPFIVMEFVAGESLRQWIQRHGRLEPAKAFAMAAAVADALRAAHEKGIVHRDIKPANILLRAEDGAAKIADFGVARLPGSDLTQHGTALGSPAYMSPEQIEGFPARPASDLFSLAVILYECLCGQRPFAGESLSALAWAITHKKADPVSRHLNACPPALDAFFDKALAKDPSARFRSGDEFRAALASATGDAESKLPRPVSRAGALEMAGFALLAMAGIVLAAWSIYDDGSQTLPLSAAKSTVSAVARPPLRGCLLLHVKSNIKAGTMTLIVDRDQVYTRRLSAPQGVGFPLLKKSERFEARIKVAAGRHTVTAQVRPLGKAKYQDSIFVELKAGETRKLELVAGRTFGAPLSLKVD